MAVTILALVINPIVETIEKQITFNILCRRFKDNVVELVSCKGPYIIIILGYFLLKFPSFFTSNKNVITNKLENVNSIKNNVLKIKLCFIYNY